MHPVLFEIGGRPVFAFGTFLAIGFFLAYLYAGWRCRRINVSDTHVLNIFIILIIAGVTGSRLMAVAINPELYADLKAVLNVASGGMAYHGGFLLALSLAVVYLWWQSLPIAQVLDRYAPAVPLAHASGRVGCFLYGCCYGLPCELPWAIRMPPADAGGQWHYRHPTQLYELVLLLVLSYALHRLIDRPHRAGMVMVAYGYGYPLVRFPLEFIRADNLLEPHYLHLSVGQLACLGMVVVAGVAHLWLRHHPEQAAAEPRRSR